MKIKQVKAPSRKNRLELRFMIIIGVACIVFFMRALLDHAVVGYKPLYILLLITFVFTFIKIIFEWYHYWSISVPVTPPVTKQYTVDVFTTFCAGEPYEMIVETLTAIQAIKYPHQTYLCDEANDPYLSSVCATLGVHHITRTDKRNAKAGNINNALQQSTGELCVVLDPDHIPVPHFFEDIVSHFDNPEVGYVQIVQAYYNQRTGWIAKGAAQQTYHFYGPMMMCMHKYGTVQAIGANCTFRRTALESIGGHAAGLAEDMHTSMQLQAQKWKSVYVPKVLSVGLVPATLSAYYKQQLKWSRGVFELFVTTYFKLFSSFTWRQRLHYILLPLFYLSGFVFLINFLIPVISLVTDLFPLQMDFSAFMVISVPFVTSVVLIRLYVQRWVMEDNERGFHVVGGLLLIGTWWVFILGVVYTLIRKKVPYIPTPKEAKDEKNLKINLPNIAILVISIAAIIYGLINDWNPYTIFMAGIVSLNCLFMIFMLMASAELKFQTKVARHRTLNKTVGSVKSFKRHFWLLRRRVYSGVRSVSLLLMIIVLAATIYLSRDTAPNISPLTTVADANSLKSEGAVVEKPLISLYNLDTADVATVIKANRLWGKTLRNADTTTIADKITLQPNYALAKRGVIYTKGNHWFKNVYALTKKTLDNDFEQMKMAGINEFKIYGPNIYDKSIFDAARDQNLNICYGFFLPGPISFVHNTDNLKSVQETVLAIIAKNKSNNLITGWNLGNSTLQQLNGYYNTPQLYYAQNNYLKWLKQLVREMKLLDTTRKVTVDVEASPTLNLAISLLHEQIPQIDAFGIIVHDKNALKNVPAVIAEPTFYSSVDPQALDNLTIPQGGIYLANWQDQQSASIVTFDGLKDVSGRNKPCLARVSKQWHGQLAPNNLPPVKILRPALTALPENSLKYNALVYQNHKWVLAGSNKTDLVFEWYMVKTDTLGNGFTMTKLGKGPDIDVAMPKDIATHRLYLIAAKGNNVNAATSRLNLPLKK